MLPFCEPMADDEPGGSSEPLRAKLRNTRLIQPLLHGDGCVGLSGVYSVVNAIRLVLADKRNPGATAMDELLTAGLRFMDGRLTPARAATSGLRVSLWRQLAEALTDRTRHRHRVLVFAERIYVDNGIDRMVAWSSIEENIRARRAVLLLTRGGRYTVVNGYTPSSLLLFDSGWSYWISKRATGVPGDCAGARHIIYPSSFMTVRA